MKSCIPVKDKEEEEVNQEVPQNVIPSFQNRLSISVSQPSFVKQIQAETAPISWQPNFVPRRIPQPAPPPDLPNAKLSEEHNWQANVHSARERNAVLFNNTLMADVYFLVGEEGNQKRIPSHKYVLGAGSSVFCAMLYGGLAEQVKVMEIAIPDVEPAAFLNLLR